MCFVCTTAEEREREGEERDRERERGRGEREGERGREGRRGRERERKRERCSEGTRKFGENGVFIKYENMITEPPLLVLFFLMEVP